jgi:hypothetical protein
MLGGDKSQRINQIIAAERIVRNDEVVGSIPTSSTKTFNHLRAPLKTSLSHCCPNSKALPGKSASIVLSGLHPRVPQRCSALRRDAGGVKFQTSRALRPAHVSRSAILRSEVGVPSMLAPSGQS